MDIDEAFRVVGQYGRIQRQVFWSMAIPQAFVAWQHILNVFVGAQPRFYCVGVDSRPLGGPNNCTAVPCTSYKFVGDDFTSIASEWNLVCGSAYKSDLVQSFFMAGLLVGNLVGGVFADQRGRRDVVIAGIFGLTLFSILAAAPLTSPNFVMYVCWRIAAGVCTGAYGLVSFTLPAELVSSAERGFVNVITTVAFALGIASLAPLAYFIRDWRMLSVLTALPGLIGIYYYIVIPESPRWLLTQGRVEDAEKVLDHIAFVNHGRPLSEPTRLRPVVGVLHSKEAGLWDLIRHRTLRRRTLNNVFTWFVNSLVYYGLTLKAGSLGSNKYVSLALAGLIEIPADFATLYSMERCGRRATYSFSMLAGGFFAIIIALVPTDHVNLITVFALLGKIGISVSFCVCWMHAVEMYPTNIRNKALSVCNTSSRLGGVICPFVLTLGRSYVHLDFLIFGALTISAGLLSLKLPETANQPMPETIDEIGND